MSFGGFVATLFFLAIGAMLVFFGLHRLHVPVGSLPGWMVGVGILWWLGMVTMLPWNAHFAALAVVQEAHKSCERGVSLALTFARPAARAYEHLAERLRLMQHQVHCPREDVQELPRANAREHEALARQTAQETAKLSEDARFLNQVRELIRFVKTAWCHRPPPTAAHRHRMASI